MAAFPHELTNADSLHNTFVIIIIIIIITLYVEPQVRISVVITTTLSLAELRWTYDGILFSCF